MAVRKQSSASAQPGQSNPNLTGHCYTQAEWPSCLPPVAGVWGTRGRQPARMEDWGKERRERTCQDLPRSELQAPACRVLLWK